MGGIQNATKRPSAGVRGDRRYARGCRDTDSGLTGPEIGYLLQNCRIPDPTPTVTKWKRLFNAFVEFQNQRQFGNHVVVFMKGGKRKRETVGLVSVPGPAPIVHTAPSRSAAPLMWSR